MDERPAQDEQDGRQEEPGQTGQPGQPEQPEQAARPGQPEESEQSEQLEEPEQPEQPEEPLYFELPTVTESIITHDAFFKFVVRDKTRLMQLLRHYWPPKIVALLDDQREPEFMDGHYVNRQLQISQSDFLVKLYLKDGGYLFGLGEHKSRHEASTMGQVYGYYIEVMSHYGQEADLGEAPIVIPTVFHHGKDKWTSPITHLLPNSPAAKKDISELMPEDFRRAFRPLLVKLSDQELEDMPPEKELRASLLALIGSRGDGDSTMLAQIFTDLRDNESFLWQVKEYIINNWAMEPEDINAVAREVNAQDKTGDAVMRTAAERLVDRGMAKGIVQGKVQGMQQGKVEGMAHTLIKQLRWKFRHLPADAEARISAASIDELDAWAKSTLTAESLDEVFAAKPH